MSGESTPKLGSAVCPQKIFLFEAYQAATQQHSNSLAELTLKIGTSTRMEYVVMYRTAEILRKDASDLRTELEWHTKHHA